MWLRKPSSDLIDDVAVVRAYIDYGSTDTTATRSKHILYLIGRP